MSLACLASGLLVSGCGGSIAHPAGAASNGGPFLSPLLPADQRVDGRSYAQWEAASWMWELAEVRSYDRSGPRARTCDTDQQPLPMWFLFWSPESELTRDYVVTCSIPSGSYLVLPAPSIDCSTDERPPFHASTNVGLVACARRFWREIKPISSLSVDGRAVTPPGVDVETGVFSFSMPARNNVLYVPGRTSGRMAVVGRPAILRPLSPGHHTVISTFRYITGPYHVTIHLLVQ